MKTIIASILFLNVVFALHAQRSEEKLVRETFSNYKNAILTDKGDEAVNYVDSRTVAYYGKILDLVRNASADDVRNLPIMDKFMVLTVRHKVERKELISFDGRGLLVHAIKTGMVGKNSVSSLNIADVTIENEFAKGQLESNGKKAPAYFHFYKEEGQWRIDLTSLFSLTSAMFQKLIAESEKSDEDFILELLEMASGKKPDESIWNPVK
jgi:hypothetical protein